MAGTRSATPPGTRPDAQQQVVEWREHVLETAGYPPEIAERIAASDADLHLACDVLERGCSPELAEQILL